MKKVISKVKPESIAMEMGVEPGDIFLSINGEAVKDIIDYKFLMTDEYMNIEIEKPDGEIWALEFEKNYDEDFGIEFENSILDQAKSCRNKCIFCFIDQLPKGMRESLYFKDDDSRLSFLQGNFVTLTNMSDEDIERVIRYRISPINISVHTTNPELRKKMLKNRFAGNILERLEKLAAAGIRMNAQIVTVPGVNNGEELIKTVEDLYAFYPQVENVAAVPVGITKYREGLAKLQIFDKESAIKELEAVAHLQHRFMKEIGEPFIRLSDEFYILADKEIPQSDFYGGFHQLEDGVGMVRILRENIKSTIKDLDQGISGEIALITGASGYGELKAAAEKIMQHNQEIKLNVIRVMNDFFGHTITVAGLLTGRDIINSLKNNEIKGNIIIPKNMLRAGESVFLDDVTLQDIEKATECKAVIAEYTGEDLIAKINDVLKEG